jgi:hypothetical protein
LVIRLNGDDGCLLLILRIFGSCTFLNRLDPKETCAFGLFDHLVGAAEKRQRHGKPERLGSLEIDDQLDFRGLLDRQIDRLLTLENPAGVDADRTLIACP